MKASFIWAVWFCFSVGLYADEKLKHAAAVLEANRLYTGEPEQPENVNELRRKISATNDPNSKFGYIVFSLARHRKKLLTEDQSEQLNALIEARKASPVNWHDNRNIVRVHAVFELWKYASAVDPETAEQHKTAWQKWTDLRLAYMFQEFIDKERFQRKAWNLLTAEQQQKLLSGEWDQFLKKSTGHKRIYSAPKQVTKALGPPDHPEAFASVAEKWQAKWEPMLQDYLAASVFQQKREFSMNLADESFAAAAWEEYATEFRKFVTMERDAIRELVQTGYDSGQDLDTAVGNTIDKFRQGMVEKYGNKPNGIALTDLL